MLLKDAVAGIQGNALNEVNVGIVMVEEDL